ncbi:MAG: DUF4346 domain-containing protein [archaeon]
MKTPATLSDDVKVIRGSYHNFDDWVQDEKGYFLIRLNKKNKTVELGYCKKLNIIEVVIEGKTPQEVYFTAIEQKLVSRLDHAAYLGKELEKAYVALKLGIEYVQDEELNFVLK